MSWWVVQAAGEKDPNVDNRGSWIVVCDFNDKNKIYRKTLSGPTQHNTASRKIWPVTKEVYQDIWRGKKEEVRTNREARKHIWAGSDMKKGILQNTTGNQAHTTILWLPLWSIPEIQLNKRRGKRLIMTLWTAARRQKPAHTSAMDMKEAGIEDVLCLWKGCRSPFSLVPVSQN